MKFFPLSWHEEVDSNSQIIECFGWSESKEYCCLFIEGFTPYLYVKLCSSVVSRDMEHIKNILRNPDVKTSRGFNMRSIPYEKMKHITARGLYTNLLKGKEDFCFISFKNTIHRAMAAKALKKKYQVCENNASAVLQMTCCREINTADWFEAIVGAPNAEKRTLCDAEFTLHWKELRLCSEKPAFVPRPVVMCYDIETFAHDINIFPDPKHPDDEIFQISIIFSQGDTRKCILLTLGTPDFDLIDEKVEVYCFKDEAKMLMYYATLVKENAPQILIGYNTFGFDNRYLVERAKFRGIYDDFVRHGYTRDRVKLYQSNWSSSAYSNQEFCYLDLKGRIHVDLLLFVQREYKLDSYKLNSVAMHFLGARKDPLNHYHIRECYLKGMKSPQEPSKALSYVGTYCVKDSALVLDLYEKLKFWDYIVSMASVCQTSVVDLFTHGQTKKIFCQVYKYCSDKGIIVENDTYFAKPDEIVEGAFVLPPKAGLYNDVVSFDFASLYPSIIISHNIDFSTLVQEDEKIEDEKCHVIEWEEHYGCGCENAKPVKKMKDGKKVTICKNYRVRWLKEPKGVIPTIIENLLRARKEVRNNMKSLAPESAEYDLLNQRQLAFKVCANSMYGGFSSRFGALQFLIGGMSITAVGRRSIQRVKEIMEKDYPAMVIYGDTDSNYVKFRVLREQLYEFCLKVSKEVSAHFPRPMSLEFEGKIYEMYLIFTKKRYIYKLVGKDDLKVSGVLLKRRDNAPIVKEIYGDLVNHCLKGVKEADLWARFMEHASVLLAGFRKAEQYAIGRSVKTIDSFNVQPRSATKIRFGCYIIAKLSEDPKKRAMQLKKKGATDELDFCYKSLPNHVQLALKMRNRGQTIQNGARLSFIYIKGDPKALTVEKMEDIEFFELYHHNSDIDTAEYFRLLCERPLAELFSVYLGRDCSEFFQKIWKTAVLRNALNDEYKELFLRHRLCIS